MRIGSSTLALLALAAAFVSLQASAQDAAIQFRLEPATGNPALCSTYDASLSRVHTVTMSGATATIKSAGGIDDTMKETSPKIYTTVFQLAGKRFPIVADASKTPRTLSVTEPDYGCKWNAIAP
jgi:hypothetical protein